jgi:hypothetical protein
MNRETIEKQIAELERQVKQARSYQLLYYDDLAEVMIQEDVAKECLGEIATLKAMLEVVKTVLDSGK